MENKDFAYGFHAVKEAIEKGRGNKLFMQEDSRNQRLKVLKEIATEYSVPFQWVPRSKLEELSDGGLHQGAVLGVAPFEYLSLEELLGKVEEKEEPFLLILDSIEDPHNFGSILRTADAVGVDGVIIPKHRAVGVTSIVAKTSTGAVENIPIARVTNLVDTINRLKEEQYWIFGTDMSGTDYRQWNVAGSIALVIGNEGRGLSTLVKKEVDEIITIPMVGEVQSLNASVSAGVLMYEVLRKRHP